MDRSFAPPEEYSNGTWTKKVIIVQCHNIRYERYRNITQFSMRD